ncbi:uncharacterized protein LOC132559280 [Ylistrum balloti]|uniref:uncharacterized protein LOC132559280 n=1 Tax=Ylistrum balloti TaxID=509963 RepID=UPI002905D1C8|nr:uncharacterized protein LOC132559280 [Ylistrum balloti]
MVSVLAGHTINIENFKHVIELQDRIEIKHGISDHTVNSLSGCAALCLGNGNCWSLFYNHVTLMCRLNKNPFLDVSETSSQSGFQHYSRVFCENTSPQILHTSKTLTLINGIPALSFTCNVNTIEVSGDGDMKCDLGTLQWTFATIICLDLSAYSAMGYTELCGTESVLKFVGNKVTFDVGKSSCMGDGAQLARPVTSIRWNCLANFAFSRSTGTHVWMDINDRNIEGTLMFSDNTLVPLPHYWLPGEPYPSSKDASDCVGIWPNKKLWDDLPCGNVAYYICEIVLS